MFSTVKEFFENKISGNTVAKAEHSTDHTIELATAALLVEMTRADYHVSAKERESVDRALSEVFGLSDRETVELVKLAEQEVREAASLYPFTSLIDKHFSQSEKIHVVEMLWRVAFSDGHKDKYEEYLVRKISDLLHVSHKDFIKARHLVEEELKI
ncbi:MAG: TerB family tellurite resistance protein [Gammaproteobacteria bacterium]